MDLSSTETVELVERLDVLLKRLDELVKEVGEKLVMVGNTREEAALIYIELGKRDPGAKRDV